jgi:hypothetical protein
MSVATGNNRSRTIEMLLLYSPVLIAILVMLPRLLSPQFGLLDDGRGLVTLDKFVNHGVWDMSVDILEGRYRPMYWLWFGLFYKLAGDNPFWFFFGNMCALASSVTGLIFLVYKATNSQRAAFFSGIFLALASPVIESYYTLSKGETLQAAMLVLSLVVISLFTVELKPGTKTILVALSTFLLLLAHTSKETSIVVLPISFVWYITARFLLHGDGNIKKRAVRGAYLLSTFISVVVYYVLRIYFVTWQMNTGSYTSRYSLGLEPLIASAIRWSGWLIRDYAYLLPLIAAGILIWIMQRQIAHGHILIDTMVWMGAWITLFLPWFFMAEYYMMPFALGAAVFGGILTDDVFNFAQNEKVGRRWSVIAALVLSMLLLIFSQFNDFSNGRIQLSVDSSNTELLSFIKTVEPDSTVFLNIQTPNEYYYKFKDYINTYWNRSDVTILPFDFQDTSSPGVYYILAPYVINQPLLAVRQGVVEKTQSKWNDSLQPYFQEHLGWQKAQQFERRFSLLGIDMPRLFCPLIKTRAFCATPAPFFDVRPFVYGWTIYKLEKP